ncbi:MAG: hypothetical protein GF400_01330, partial [Candidatus Eisenbacteria bacterium]|nr:hypothetical protein [Candidatus Eisenbacteria bacterium]
MRKSLALISALIVLGGCGGARDHDADVASLVEAERVFGRDVAEMGMKEGFLAHLGEGAVAFMPGPVNARQWYESSEDAPGLLSWEPTLADVAASGDLGYTTGPWELRPEGPGTEPVGFGHYVSVWLREPDGVWRVAIDAGVPHAPPEGPVPELVARGHARVSDPFEP